jgi:hypothetical protein
MVTITVIATPAGIGISMNSVGWEIYAKAVAVTI